jgi:hypothetical protein
MKNFVAIVNFKKNNKCKKNVFNFANNKCMFTNFKNMFIKCTQILNCKKTLNTFICLSVATGEKSLMLAPITYTSNAF